MKKRYLKFKLARTHASKRTKTKKKRDRRKK